MSLQLAWSQITLKEDLTNTKPQKITKKSINFHDFHLKQPEYHQYLNNPIPLRRSNRTEIQKQPIDNQIGRVQLEEVEVFRPLSISLKSNEDHPNCRYLTESKSSFRDFAEKYTIRKMRSLQRQIICENFHKRQKSSLKKQDKKAKICLSGQNYLHLSKRFQRCLERIISINRTSKAMDRCKVNQTQKSKTQQLKHVSFIDLNHLAFLDGRTSSNNQKQKDSFKINSLRPSVNRSNSPITFNHKNYFENNCSFRKKSLHSTQDRRLEVNGQAKAISISKSQHKPKGKAFLAKLYKQT